MLPSFHVKKIFDCYNERQTDDLYEIYLNSGYHQRRIQCSTSKNNFSRKWEKLHLAKLQFLSLKFSIDLQMYYAG